MPDHHGKLAEVRPIYRPGDRVLVEIPFGYFEVVVQWHEIRDGRLWLYGVGPGLLLHFPATMVAYRLPPHHFPWWSALR